MKNMQHNLLDELRAKVTYLDDAPDDFVWHNIEVRLSKRRKRIFAIKAFTGILVVFVTTLSVYLTERVDVLLPVAAQKQSIYPKLPLKEVPITNINGEVEAEAANEIEIVLQQTVHEKNIDVIQKSTTLQSINSALIEPTFNSGLPITENKNVSWNIDSTNQNKKDTTILVLKPEVDKKSKVARDKNKNESAKNEKNPFIAYAQFSPTINYFIVNPSLHDLIIVKDVVTHKVLSTERLGFGAEAGVSKDINSKWKFFTGLLYNSQSTIVEYQYASPSNFNVSSGASINELIIEPRQDRKAIVYKMRNAGARVSLFYTLKGEKLKRRVGIGFMYQHGINQTKNEASYKIGKSSYLFYQLLYNVEYKVSDRMSLYLQPSYHRAFFTKERTHEPLKLIPHGVGLGIGMNYSLHISRNY